MAYLDNTGLGTLWGRIKTYIASYSPVTSVNSQTGDVTLNIPTVPSNIVTGTSSSYTIWVGTQAQYEAISTKDATTIYLITGS